MRVGWRERNGREVTPPSLYVSLGLALLAASVEVVVQVGGKLPSIEGGTYVMVDGGPVPHGGI